MPENQTAAAFASDWAQHIGATGPLAHHLRAERLRPWLRFHALPNSKRDAETPEEKNIILSRADELATDMLGHGSECWLVECRGDTDSQRLATKTKGIAALKITELDDDFEWTAYVCPIKWKTGSSRRLLWQIAKDLTGPTLWFKRANGAIFAPYDGGFDLFPTSHAHVQTLRHKYADWLSDHPDGL